MKGVKMEIDAVIGNTQIDIYLPEDRMMIYCGDLRATPLDKVKQKQLKKLARTKKCRFVAINGFEFYKGLNTTLFKLKQQRLFPK